MSLSISIYPCSDVYVSECAEVCAIGAHCNVPLAFHAIAPFLIVVPTIEGMYVKPDVIETESLGQTAHLECQCDGGRCVAICIRAHDGRRHRI